MTHRRRPGAARGWCAKRVWRFDTCSSGASSRGPRRHSLAVLSRVSARAPTAAGAAGRGRDSAGGVLLVAVVRHDHRAGDQIVDGPPPAAERRTRRRWRPATQPQGGAKGDDAPAPAASGRPPAPGSTCSRPSRHDPHLHDVLAGRLALVVHQEHHLVHAPRTPRRSPWPRRRDPHWLGMDSIGQAVHEPQDAHARATPTAGRRPWRRRCTTRRLSAGPAGRATAGGARGVRRSELGLPWVP